MKKLLQIVLLSILINIIISVQAKPSKYSDTIHFDKIKTDTLINTFIQDSDGFFWIGGNNGLYKYDGYTFKQYIAGPDSVAGNDVGSLYEDSQRLIWIGSTSGLSVYDKSSDTFTTYFHDPDEPTSISGDLTTANRQQTIMEDADSMIWIGTGNGLNKFDKAHKTFTRYQGIFISDDIRSLYLDAKQFLWVGTTNGLHKFDPRNETVLERYETDNNNPDSLHGNYINAILEDHEGTLWIGTEKGINRLATDQNRFTHYRHDPNDENSLSDDIVPSIMEDTNGMLWVTTVNSGLNLFDKNTGVFTHYRHDPDNSNSINDNYLTTVYQNALGVIWFSSYGGVLHRIDLASIKFQSYTHNPNNLNTLSKGSYIAHGIEDQDGMIWIAVGGYGLNRYDRTTETFTHYRHNPDDPDSLPESYGQSVIEDKGGNLWMTTSNKIVRFDKKAGKTIRAYPALNWPSGPVEDSTNPNVIWWGTWGSGLLKFNKSEEKVSYFIPSSDHPDETVSDTEIPYLYQDDFGMLWLCTRGGGLDKFDPRIEKVVAKYKHIPTDLDTISSNLIYQIYKDSADRYWVTTDKGLDKFDLNTEKFQRFNQQNGLFPLSSASQILEDTQGYLWISGYYAGKLIRFDPNSSDYRVYTTDDGILSGIGSSHAAMRTRDGALWFFGRDGINTFYSEDVKDSLYQPPVFLTSLTQGGEPIKTGKAPERVTKIQLDWQHNFFEFEVAALNYRHAEHNQYRYKLEGIDHEWFESGKMRQGRYTGLMAGEYTLKIQGSNNDGLWSENIVELQVIVTPPWWETTWFRGTLLIVILIIGLTGYQWRIRIIKQRNHELERQVTKRTSELHESQRAMRTLISHLPGIAYRCLNDRHWTMEFISDGCLALTGYPATAFTSNAEISFTDITHSNDREYLWQTVQEALQNHQAFEVTYRITTKTGQLKWLWEQGEGVFDQNGKLVAIEGLINDISEQKQTEIALQQAKEHAEIANQAKSTFLANMSHELRSPLNAILGFAQIMTRSQKLDKENQENLGIISRSGEHLLNLINQVLDLSKIEAGRTTLNENHFDLYRLLDDLEDMFHLKADDKHLLLQFERAPSVSQYIYTDELKLRQVLINLLNNALKFTIDGGITVRIHSKTIETELKQQRAVIEFAVEDTGPGIAPEELDELFTAFVQTSTGKQAQEGTGLGLPISRKFVQLMGGDMVVTSEIGRGTIFKFQIQCQLSEASHIKQPVHEKRIIALAPEQPRYRILIVDDKWTNRQLLIKLLNPLGFELREAENGQQAIDVWEEWEPHLIWMDMRMPVMDGYTATKQIKAHIKGQAIAIIALTASILEEERAVVIDAGCDDFLRKPFKEADIFDLMHKHIGVEYIYDEPIQTATKETAADELTPDNIAKLPAELLVRFEEATALSDPEQIESLINEIRVHHPNLANSLAELAELFDYDGILDLIRQAQGLQS